MGYLSSMLKPSQAGVFWNASRSVAILSAMSQPFSVGEGLRRNASGDPMDGFSWERMMSSAYKCHVIEEL